MKFSPRFLWVFLLLVPLLWLAWPSFDKAGQDEETPPASSQTKQSPVGGSRVANGEAATETRPGLLRRPVTDRPELGDPAGVDLVLADDSISHEQAALQLRKLAMDPTRSTEDRLEALEHGLNLDAASFADLAHQKDLPSELASHYLHEMINHDDSAASQIRSYMALMDHRDPEVAGLAAEMLAFQVGDEQEEINREKLLQLAREKLAEYAAEEGE